MSAAYESAFVREHAFGIIAGVHLPAGGGAVPGDFLARLHPAETEVARTLRGFRQSEWVGGRLAWRAAAERFGVSVAPLLSGLDREPLPPRGVSVSITHKRELAVALVGDAASGDLGIDLESETSASLGIASRVLRAEEISAIEALPEGARLSALLLRFSVKEATYKAIHPRLKRLVRYGEALVEVGPGEAVTVRLHLEDGAAAPTLEAVCERLPGHFLSAVRCLPG